MVQSRPDPSCHGGDNDSFADDSFANDSYASSLQSQAYRRMSYSSTLSSSTSIRSRPLPAHAHALLEALDLQSSCGGSVLNSVRSTVRRKDVINCGDRCSITSSSRELALLTDKNSATSTEGQMVVHVHVKDNSDSSLSQELVVVHEKQPPQEPPSRHGSERRQRRQREDPPGESPTARRSSIDSDVDGGGGNGYGRPSGVVRRVVRWVDPQALARGDLGDDCCEVDRRVLDRYHNRRCEDDDNTTCEQPPLLSPPRIRVATISSGYKKANFFVREDVDQRIYFHDLEDAISYMGRRGFAKMSREDEREWMALLGRAHKTVKAGPNKKKQRYRKGKLVLVMFKPIRDVPLPTTAPSQQLLPYDAHLNSGAIVPYLKDNASIATDHTSLGRSVRAGYKSYAERFLAETMGGNTTEGAGATGGGVMLLTARPIDPEPMDEGGGGYGQGGGRPRLLRITDESREGSEMTVSKDGSSNGVALGNYGGGVMYFTPDNGKDEKSQEESVDDADDGDGDINDNDDDDDNNTNDEDDTASWDQSQDDTYISSQYSLDEESHLIDNGMGDNFSQLSESTSSSFNSEMSSVVPDMDAKKKKKKSDATGAYGKQSSSMSTPPDLMPASDESGDWSV